MVKTAELLELTDDELLSLIGRNVLIRLGWRARPETEDTDTETSDEEVPFKSVTAVGTLLELQFSADTGGAVASLYSGTDKPDEVRWDCQEYTAYFSWSVME